MLLKALSNANSSQIPTFTKEILEDRSVLFQFANVFEKGTSQITRSDIYQLTSMYYNTEIIALVKNTEVPYREYDEERDGYTEGLDDDGRKVTYFNGANKSGMVYFIDKNSGEIIGKRSVFASNSQQTSNPGLDLLDNYYYEIEKMEAELGANDRSLH